MATYDGINSLSNVSYNRVYQTIPVGPGYIANFNDFAEAPTVKYSAIININNGLNILKLGTATATTSRVQYWSDF